MYNVTVHSVNGRTDPSMAICDSKCNECGIDITFATEKRFGFELYRGLVGGDDVTCMVEGYQVLGQACEHSNYDGED